jgi:hypothetical protein
LICWGELPTKYRPAAAPLTETETPFSSTGRGGVLVVSEPPVLCVFAGARATVEVTTVSSPGAKAGAVPGLGLGVGVGVGVGVGLAVGLGVGLALGTGIKLAPVKNETVAFDSLVTVGVKR